MELLNETECNSNSDIKKKDENTLLENSAHKFISKKKFYNTVFATKMRNRKKEEKFEKLEGKEVLSACKQVSVEVTRLSSNRVPKLISSIEHRNRRKKKLKWKLGISRKKKKRDKTEKEIKVNAENISVKNNESGKNVQILEEKILVHEKDNEDREFSSDKDDTQRRKSMRHVTPVMFFDEKWDYESKPDNGPAIEEKFSCRRTELFIGKLNTREARIQNIEKILKEESKPIAQNNNNFVDCYDKDPLKQTEEDNTLIPHKSVSETNKNIENNILEACENNENSGSIENNENLEDSNKEDHENKDTDNSIVDILKSVENEMIIKESNNLLKEVIETKEHCKDKEITCRRTIPFVGKISQNASLEESEKFTEIDFITSDVNTKPESSKNIETQSESSLEDANFPKDKDTETDSLNDLNTDLNTDLNMPVIEKSQLSDSLKQKNKLNCCISESDQKINTSYKTDVRENLSDDSSDSLSNNVTLNSEESLFTNNTHEIWSCRRIEPYFGKDYPNCSRTLPFVDSVNKVKLRDTPSTSLIHSDTNLSSKSVTDRLQLDKSDELKGNKNKDKNIPENLKNEIVNTVIDSAVNTSNSSASGETVKNGEWKYKRKRGLINLKNEIQEEIRPSKKSKVIASPDSKLDTNKSSSTFLESPERTICSLYSLNCTKHAHHNLQKDECLMPHKEIMEDVFVLLTKLEYINDPLVAEYFKKIDYTNKVKQNLLPSRKNKVCKDTTTGVSLNRLRRLNSHESNNEQVAKDEFSSSSVPDTNSDSNYSNIQIDLKKTRIEQHSESERSISPPIKRATRSKRRPLSATSTESINIISSKRKKCPVNYVENFSDSDTAESCSSSLKQERAQNKNRRLTLRDRQKLRSYSNPEIDENDMEVEKFTRIGLSRSSRSKMRRTRNISSSSSAFQSNDTDDSNSFTDDVCSRTTSIAENVEKGSNIQSIDKNSNVELSNEPREHFPNEWSQDQEKSDNGVAQNLVNHLRLPTRNRAGQFVRMVHSERSRNMSPKQRVSSRNTNEQMLLLSKTSIKNDGVTTSDRFRTSAVDEFSDKPRTRSNSSRSEKDNSFIYNSRSNTPSKLSKQVKSNAMGKLSKSKSNLELLSTPKYTIKNMPLTNLKVQLIKLETVCDSFEDYSASEIELLTRKYIDLLMNSNFTCDTWRNPINYHRSGGFTEKHIEQVDNSDCVSDGDMQDESERMTGGTEIENTSVIKSALEDNVEKLNGKSSKQIETKLSSFTTLESAIATLVDADPGEQRNFGAVNISEALGTPASTGLEKEKEQIIQSNELMNEANANQDQLKASDKVQGPTGPDTILLNGTAMFPCTACSKIFVVESSLKQHQTHDHKDNDEAADGVDSTTIITTSSCSSITSPTLTSTTTNDITAVNSTHIITANSKSNTKQKSQVISSSTAKKSISKCKKKFRCSDSLKCTICSVIFDTKELLFDHIMTHNEQELQEAYKAAKAKAQQQQSETSNSLSEESDKELPQEKVSQNNEANKKKQKEKSRRKKSTDSSIRSSRSSIDTEEVVFEDPLRNACTIPGPVTVSERQEQMVDSACNEVFANIERPHNSTACNKPITICQCHAHETTIQDLQIEMVLLCKICNVVFRRRDCFEVHYRTSSDCRRRRTNNEITKMPKLFCSGCPCVLDSLMDMRAHLEMHARKNSQGTVTFICNICKVAFFGVGGIFYSHWFNHTKAPNFVASRYSFPKLSVVSVLEDSNVAMTTSKSQEGFFYIAEHVCRQCRLPFSSEPELLKHKTNPCQTQQSVVPRIDPQESNRLQMIKLICDLCKKYYVSKENFDRHCSERNHLKTPITKFSRLPINANEQAFVCSLCRAVSKSLDDMKEHWKRIHSPIMELYTCKTCNVVPSNDVTNYTYEKFERHCRIIHKSEVITCLVYFVTARYVCNICRFGFETEKSMKEHQVIHQKRSSQNNNVSASGLPIEPQTTTLWVADKQVAADGGRKVHPVYVHYPGINGNMNHPVPMLPTPVPVNHPSSNHSHIRHTNHVNNQVNVVTSNVVSNPSTNASSNPGNTTTNSMLRSMLAQRALDQQHLPQQSNKNSPNVETIFIDSRSNSPLSESPVTSTDKSGTSNTDAGVSRKAYMTMVNPNFESLLGTNSITQMSESNNCVLDKENSDSGGNATPVSMDSLTPQPFEVVLVTDDLSENSNCDLPNINDRTRPSTEKIIDMANSSLNQQKQLQSTECNESPVIKSSKFLRVRSIAELQRMKINLCSICGLSFDTLQAFEQHSQQHEMAGELNRTTPVQMISPMLAQGNKASKDPKNVLISQMRKKMALLIPTGKEMANSLDTHNKTNSSAIINHLQHPQHHPQPPYWFASCNGRYNAPPTSMGYNAYSRQHPQHYPQPHYQQHQNEQMHHSSMMRRPVNLSNSGGNYIPRGPPPAYPSTSSSMVPSRPSAIQLPDRNTAGNATPTTKRPSGAATRIPQQSLPNYSDINEHRQASSRIPYSSTVDVNNSRSMTSAVARHSQHPHFKSYSRHSGEFNYSGSIGNNSNYHHSQQQHPSKIIYSCKLQGCHFRTDSFSALRAHEKNHVNQQICPIPSNQMQQQRLPLKHVPVSQMPERPRHPIPTLGRQPTNIPEKRNICRLCNFCCSTDPEMLDHVAQCHGAVNNQVCCYVCDYCSNPLIFETEDLLRKHMNVYHNHSCEFCNKRYPSKEDLMLHMEVHARGT